MGCFKKWSSLSICEKLGKMWRTQMEDRKKKYDNGDDHDEGWMKNPPIYNKVVS